MLRLCSTCPSSSSEKAEERARASESVRLRPGTRSPRASQHSSRDHREDHMVLAMLAVPGVAGTEQRKPSSICFSSPPAAVGNWEPQERGLAREVSEVTNEHSGAQR